MRLPTFSQGSALGLPLMYYCIMLVLAIVFYLERTVILDASFVMMLTVKDSTLSMTDRFGAFVTQIVPVTLSYFGVPLRIIAMAYSASFIIFYASTFLVIFKVFKNKNLAISLLLFNILMVAHSFFWIQCELVQGVVIGFLFLGLAENTFIHQSRQLLFVTLSPILIMTIAFVHPLTVIPLVFGLLFLSIKHSKSWPFFLGNAVALCTIWVIKHRFFSTGYDSSAMQGVQNLKQFFPNYFEMPSITQLGQYFATDYLFAPISLLIVTIHYINKRRPLELLLVWSFFMGYCLLICANYATADAQRFYLESQFLVLAVFVGMPLAYDVLPNLQNPKIGQWALMLIFSVTVIRILATSTHYTERVAWYRMVIDGSKQFKHKKIIIPQSNVNLEKINMTWGSASEFWLLSTIETGESRSIIIEEHPNEFNWRLGKNVLVHKWQSFDYASLNPLYFKMKDTDDYVHYELPLK